MLTQGNHCTGRPDGDDERGSGHCRDDQEGSGQEGCSQKSDRPGPASARKGQQNGDSGQDQRLDGKGGAIGERVPEGRGDVERVGARGKPEIRRRRPVERK